ncbi:MAG: nucleoside deaminase [Candidatus Omnitrophota bacterium]
MAVIRLNKKFMQVALDEAGKNLKNMQGGPFGACIVRGNKILAVARNTVLKGDATAHAEINAIRKACRKLGDYNLSGCCIYSTTEPCPMCFSAIHWARIDYLVFGTTIKDARSLGFNELPISCRKLKKTGKSKLQIFAPFMLGECKGLFTEWSKLKNKILY